MAEFIQLPIRKRKEYQPRRVASETTYRSEFRNLSYALAFCAFSWGSWDLFSTTGNLASTSITTNVSYLNLLQVLVPVLTSDDYEADMFLGLRRFRGGDRGGGDMSPPIFLEGGHHIKCSPIF